jgi:hypothetical protein
MGRFRVGKGQGPTLHLIMIVVMKILSLKVRNKILQIKMLSCTIGRNALYRNLSRCGSTVYNDVCCHEMAMTLQEQNDSHFSLHYSSHHQIACFKVTEKSFNVATRTAEPRRVMTVQNSSIAKLAPLYR